MADIPCLTEHSNRRILEYGHPFRLAGILRLTEHRAGVTLPPCQQIIIRKIQYKIPAAV